VSIRERQGGSDTELDDLVLDTPAPALHPTAALLAGSTARFLSLAGAADLATLLLLALVAGAAIAPTPARVVGRPAAPRLVLHGFGLGLGWLSDRFGSRRRGRIRIRNGAWCRTGSLTECPAVAISVSIAVAVGAAEVIVRDDTRILYNQLTNHHVVLVRKDVLSRSQGKRRAGEST